MENVTRIQRRDDPTVQHDVLDSGTRFYVIPGIDLEPTTVSKDDYEPVPVGDPAWVDVTATIHMEIGTGPASKVSFFLGHKRIGYVLLHPPYRLRQRGERFIIERPDAPVVE